MSAGYRITATAKVYRRNIDIRSAEIESNFTQNGVCGNYDLPQSELADKPTLREA